MAYDWRSWLELADGHLKNAELALGNGGYYVTALLGHQAAEQALKGLWLVAADGLPPRTHNLVELARGLGATPPVVEAAARLTPHFIASRYPDVAEGNPMANYTKQLAGELLDDKGGGGMVLRQPPVLKAQAAEEQRRVIEAVTRLAARCAGELQATSVLLFGSRARTDWHRGSDCDVLVVSELFEGMTLSERWWAVYRRWEGPVELSPIAITPAEFELGKQGSGGRSDGVGRWGGGAAPHGVPRASLRFSAVLQMREDAHSHFAV